MSASDDIPRDNYGMLQFYRQQGHNNFLRKAETALAFFVGKQWSDEERSEMLETGRPVLTLNQYFRNIDSIVGEMIYATGDVRFTPQNIGQGNDDVSSVLDKTYLNIMQRNKVEYMEPNLLLQGLLTGRAYYDARVDFDDNMMGNVTIEGKRPQNIVLNPGITSPDTKTWPDFMETSMVSIDDIALAYGDSAAKEIRNTPQSTWLSPYDLAEERLLSQRMNGTLVGSTGYYDTQFGESTLLLNRRLLQRQYRELRYREHFIDPTTGDMSIIPPEWSRDQIQRVLQATGVQVIKRRTKVIRWQVTCDKYMLHDDESPYKDFTIVPFFPYFVDGYTMGLGEQLIDMQRMTNKLYSQVLHILNSASNSGWKVKQGALKNMTMEELETNGAKTGQTYELDDVNNMERIEPGTMPTGHDSLAATISNMFKDISGYTQSMAGQDGAEASGTSLDFKLARGQVNLATAFKSLYFTKTQLAERIRDNIKEFYTETRLLHVSTGFNEDTQHVPMNQPTAEGKILNDVTSGEYGVTIVPAPSRETIMASTFQQLSDMREKLGMQIPDSVMIQYSAIPDKSQVTEAIKANSDPQAAAQQAQLNQQEQQAKIAQMNAGAGNSVGQTELAKARALKAVSDAGQNPQADRLALDKERMLLEHQRGVDKDAQQQSQHDDKTALALTGLHQQNQQAQNEQAQNVVAGHADRVLDIHKNAQQVALQNKQIDNQATAASEATKAKTQQRPKTTQKGST